MLRIIFYLFFRFIYLFKIEGNFKSIQFHPLNRFKKLFGGTYSTLFFSIITKDNNYGKLNIRRKVIVKQTLLQIFDIILMKI